MKKYTIAVTIFGLASLAQAETSEVKKTAIGNIVSRCEGVIIDNKQYVLAVGSGSQHDEAIRKAAVGSTFNQQQFDLAASSGMAPDDAIEFATTYRYSDNSKFCVELRNSLKSEMLKAVSR